MAINARGRAAALLDRLEDSEASLSKSHPHSSVYGARPVSPTHSSAGDYLEVDLLLWIPAAAAPSRHNRPGIRPV